MMISERSSLKIQKFCAWAGIIFVLLTVIGFFGFGHFYSPVPADTPAQAMKDWFVSHQLSMAIGMTIWLISCAFLGLWTSQLSAMLAKAERGTPVMAISQLCGGFGVVFFCTLAACLWISAGYRPEASPDLAVAFNDAAWLGFVLAYPLLSLQMIAPSVVGLSDPDSWMPRWFAWYGVAGGILGLTANGAAFTTTGLFAYGALLGYYWPMVCWGLWLVGMSCFMLRKLNKPI
jgi:hypothetical protein